jgi:hypothetical protein
LSETIDRIYRIDMIFFAFPDERQKVFISLRGNKYRELYFTASSGSREKIKSGLSLAQT